MGRDADWLASKWCFGSLFLFPECRAEPPGRCQAAGGFEDAGDREEIIPPAGEAAQRQDKRRKESHTETDQSTQVRTCTCTCMESFMDHCVHVEK